MTTTKKAEPYKIFIYFMCILFSILSIFPFWMMIMNATRSNAQIMRFAIGVIPSTKIFENMSFLYTKETYRPWLGFLNSAIIASGATLCSVYFSCLTAYALMVYDWRLRQPFYTVILGVMMIPAQVSAIGFYQFMLRIHMDNSYLPLIIPAIASPAIVFFMRQYLLASLHLDIVSSSRIDGAGEFKTFNSIIIPLMKPAIATQAIFVFVGSWNNYFMPMILLTNKDMYTMPIMVGFLRGDIYRVNYGAIYLALTLSVIPIFIVYFALSKYIIAGVALGGVKE